MALCSSVLCGGCVLPLLAADTTTVVSDVMSLLTTGFVGSLLSPFSLRFLYSGYADVLRIWLVHGDPR